MPHDRSPRHLAPPDEVDALMARRRFGAAARDRERRSAVARRDPNRFL